MLGMNMLCPTCRQVYAITPGTRSICPKCNVQLVPQAGSVTMPRPAPQVASSQARTAGPPSGSRADSTLGAMFDLSFERFATPAVVKVAYIAAWILFALEVFAGVLCAAWTITLDTPAGMKALFIAGIFAGVCLQLVVVAIIRVGLEAILIVFRCEEHLDEIRRRKP